MLGASHRTGVAYSTIRKYVVSGRIETVAVDGGRKIAASELKKIKRLSQLGKTRCRECHKKRKLFRQGRCEKCYSEWEGSKKRSARNDYFLRQFGITAAEHQKMFEAQGGVCAICGEPESETRGGVTKRLAVDHDHKTGKVRALLCGRCNRLLHALERDGWLKLAKKYLKSHHG